MPRKPNYDFEKRQKELARQAKREAKRAERQQRRDERQPSESATSATDDVGAEPSNGEGDAATE